MRNLTETTEWQALTNHLALIRPQHMREWFANDSARFDRLSLSVGDILLDYSRNRINDQTLSLLANLAQLAELKEKIKALYTGSPLNFTEMRPALHTALRDPYHTPLFVNNDDIAPKIRACLQKMAAFTTQIHDQTWLGATGKPITHIVNIGIGGSHLGPKMAIHALKAFDISQLRFDFISSVDDTHLHEVLAHCDPEQTLFIVSSKTFTTIETLTNAATIKTWVTEKLGANAIPRHFVAVTAANEKAIAFGIPEANIFPLWEWVGGRYSVWSAVGLPLMLSIGSQQFTEFLNGAHEMDQHFASAPFLQNMPVILGLLDIWYANFFGTTAKAIVPYTHRLRLLIPYLQQAEMESNGKRVNRTGQPLEHATAPILFGEEGSDGQHAYHQLLHQGTNFTPVDFILTGSARETPSSHDEILLASCLSQAQALMQGKTVDEAYASLLSKHPEEKAKALAPHLVIPGNRPSNILFLKKLTPHTLGMLIALYEHKIFVQGIIWQINSFDQWGVELGKQLLPDVLTHIQSGDQSAPMNGLLSHLLQKKG